jgi:hypothetical protein
MERIIKDVLERLDREAHTKKDIGRELGLIRIIEVMKKTISITYEMHSNVNRPPEQMAKSEQVREAINAVIADNPHAVGKYLAREMHWISFRDKTGTK